MEKLSLSQLVHDKIAEAHAAKSGRASVTLFGGRDHRLRQTLITMCAGQALAEHRSPGEATLHVLSGRIVLKAESDSWELRSGDMVGIPDELHSVDIIDDSAFILTVSKREVHES